MDRFPPVSSNPWPELSLDPSASKCGCDLQGLHAWMEKVTKER
jgi:hypothetical protein